MQITIEHGLQSVTVTRPDGTTVGQLVNDANIKSVVGAGENVVPVVEGATVDAAYVLEDGDTVTLQGRAATKG